MLRRFITFSDLVDSKFSFEKKRHNSFLEKFEVKSNERIKFIGLFFSKFWLNFYLSSTKIYSGSKIIFFKKKVFQKFILSQRGCNDRFCWPNESLYSFLQCTRVAMEQYLCENEIEFVKVRN